MSASSGFVRRRAGLGGAFFVSDQAFGVVSSQTSGTMEDGVRAIGIGSHLHPGFDEVRPQRAFRDLQLQTVVGNAIVVADLTLFLHAKLLLHAKHLVEQAVEEHEAGSSSEDAVEAGVSVDVRTDGILKPDSAIRSTWNEFPGRSSAKS